MSAHNYRVICGTHDGHNLAAINFFFFPIAERALYKNIHGYQDVTVFRATWLAPLGTSRAN